MGDTKTATNDVYADAVRLVMSLDQANASIEAAAFVFEVLGDRTETRQLRQLAELIDVNKPQIACVIQVDSVSVAVFNHNRGEFFSVAGHKHDDFDKALGAAYQHARELEQNQDPFDKVVTNAG